MNGETIMQITITLPQDLEQDLMRRSIQFNVSLQTLIINALRDSSDLNFAPEWSDIILSYTGVSDFPAFESYRDELVPPELELF